MLNVFRNNLKRFAPILWVVIAVFVLLVFTDYSNNNQVGTSADTAAKVGDYEISFGELQQSHTQLEQRYREIYGEAFSPELSKQLNLPIQALNAIVRSKIQREEARGLGLQATTSELQDFILSAPLFQNETGGFVGDREYRELVQRNLRTSVDQFEEDLRESILDNKIQSILSDAAWISDAELEEAAREQAERAKIRYVSLDGAALADEVEVTPEELQAYYDANQADYEVGEQRRAAYLSVNVNTVRATLEVPEEEIRAYYDANPTEFTQEEQVRARHILLFVNEDRTAEQAQAELEAIKARVEGGEDFGTIAQQASEDEASKPQGGDLGFFPRGRMTQPFEEAAFGAEQGQLVGPIENQLGPRTGYHLIEIIAKRPGGVQPFEEVSNRIQVRLLNERSQTETEALAQRIASQLAGDPPQGEEALRAVAEQEGVAVEVLEAFGVDDNLPGIGRGTELAQTIFASEPGGLSDPIRIPAGWAIAQVLSIDEPRTPELAEVENEVRAAVVSERQAELAQERLASFKDQVANGERTLDQVASSLGVEVQESIEFGANDRIATLPGVDGLNDAALALEAGDVGGPLASPSGAVLFEVSERKHFDPVSFEAGKESSREQLRAQRVNSLVGAWIQSKLTDLDFQYTPQMVEMFDLEAQLPTDS